MIDFMSIELVGTIYVWMLIK